MMNFICGMTTMALIGMVTGVSPERAIENLHAWARLFREFVRINRQSPAEDVSAKAIAYWPEKHKHTTHEEAGAPGDKTSAIRGGETKPLSKIEKISADFVHTANQIIKVRLGDKFPFGNFRALKSPKAHSQELFAPRSYSFKAIWTDEEIAIIDANRASRQ